MRRRGRGAYGQDKPPVIVMVSRESKSIVIAPSKDVSSEVIAKRAMNYVEQGSTIYHDDFRSYGILDGLFKHDSVNHSEKEYARGDIHVNTAEAEFSLFRPWLRTYRGVSKKRLYLYCSHYQMLRNARKMGRVERTLSMLGLSSFHPHRERYLNLSDPEPILSVALNVSAYS